AIRALRLGILCQNPAEYSHTLTAVIMPEGMDSDAYIDHAQRTRDLSLGVGLGAMKGKVFRIGHLGSLNELELLGALAGVELTLKSFGVPLELGAGLAAAEHYLLS
ncbi:MAG: serine--glyoxylate aminotransferase, partial [Candidatus Methylomirabilia bacterium]